MNAVRELDKVLCDDIDAVNLMTLIDRLNSLYQWVRIGERGEFTIFNQKPERGPMYAWKDTMAYIPFKEDLHREFERKCAHLETSLITADELICVAFNLAHKLDYTCKAHKSDLIEYKDRLYYHQLRLERKKSEDLMHEMLVYFRKHKYPSLDLCPMLRTFERYNYEI